MQHLQSTSERANYSTKELYRSIWGAKDQQTDKKVGKGYEQTDFGEENANVS